MKNNCDGFWGQHTFGKWERKDEGRILIQEREIGCWISQERTCEECGFVELNLQEEY